jgi:hypothetical protein
MKQHNIRAILEKHPIIPVVTFHALSEVVPQLEKLESQPTRCNFRHCDIVRMCSLLERLYFLN